jgi:hypothetical protein
MVEIGKEKKIKGLDETVQVGVVLTGGNVGVDKLVELLGDMKT